MTVGTRFGSTWMDAASNSKNWENVAVVARTESSRKEAGKRFGIDDKHQYSDLETAISQCSDVDAVVIAVPNDLHYEMAKIVLDHGLNLILEKPITETWEQCIDLVRRLDSQPGLKACVGQTLRGEFFLRMMEYHLEQGIIGKIEQVTFESHGWWATDDPESRRNWRFQLENMFLDDIGIHQIDLIRMLLSNRKSMEVFGQTLTPPSYPLKNIKTTASGIWLMEDDIPVNYFGS
ncbi:MAG: Gfo/Idh/MocA family protein, partial [Promethearchaeota archaeon]